MSAFRKIRTIFPSIFPGPNIAIVPKKFVIGSPSPRRNWAMRQDKLFGGGVGFSCGVALSCADARTSIKACAEMKKNQASSSEVMRCEATPRKLRIDEVKTRNTPVTRMALNVTDAEAPSAFRHYSTGRNATG